MYKPPQNSNRVKSIKSKFENIDNIENKEPQKNNLRQNGFRNNLNFSPSKRADNLVTQNNIATKNVKLPESSPKNEKSLLQRQMSDPCKRNIKRTPAFRVDKSLERTNEFQRNSFDRSTLFETKVKQFSAVKNNCDTNSNLVVSEVCEKQVVKVPKKPLLVKSKSSLDFEYIRSKFDKKSNNNTSVNNENPSKSDKLNDVDLSLLYTEPIPKSLRNKNINEVMNHVNIEPLPKNDIYNCSTLKVSDKPLFSNLQYEGLTDTLKAALKKPLPPGPAPKKPPRTFEHSSVENVGKNVSFLHLSKLVEKNLKAKVISPPKKDPRYMLSKLENAVRNKKLRVRQQPKIDISTSGEDSDDSLLFRSKTNKIEHCSDNRTLPRVPSQGENCSNSTFNLNCLNSLSCSISNYEKIKEPNSCFFVGSFEEPVYAEPFHFAKDPELVLRNMEGSTRSKDTTKSARNSLYYMSTPVLNEISRYPVDMNGSGHDQDDIKLPDLQLTGNLLRRPSAENSSLSSFTSDLDSTPSPMEESATVQSILQCFEAKSAADNGCHIDSTNRVENLKNCIRSTLERSFAPDSAIFRDSDSENNDESKLWDIIRKFENYRQTMPKYCKPKVHNDTLFYCCLIIDKFKDVVQIKYKYPSCVDIPQNLESLCFPENDSALLYSTNTAQSYSLLITNDKGERMFGYCRRVLPEGCTRSLPLAYCILSKYRAPRFYKKILHEIESRHGIPTKYRDELICQFYHQKFPKPGDSIKINLTNIEPQAIKTDPGFEDSVDLQNYVLINKTGEHLNIKGNSERLEKIFVSDNDVKMSCTTPSYILENEGKRELILTLHPDTRYEDADLKLLHQLPDDVLLKIFSSLLLERKIILISSSIGVLSSCVDSLQSILYPFIWHHTFIPILPQQLWDIVESPTPVICGVLSKQVVEDHQIENGIVVDLDSRTVIKEEGDENKILSASMQKVWRRNIALANRATASKEYVHSVFLSDAYLQVFILCFKDYKKYFVDGNFMKEEFLKKKTKGVKRFLKMFTETYMFLAFLDTAVANDENLAEFHKKIEMYGSNESDIILDKLLGWNK